MLTSVNFVRCLARLRSLSLPGAAQLAIVALGGITALGGCEEYTCVDTATCAPMTDSTGTDTSATGSTVTITPSVNPPSVTPPVTPNVPPTPPGTTDDHHTTDTEADDTDATSELISGQPADTETSARQTTADGTDTSSTAPDATDTGETPAELSAGEPCDQASECISSHCENGWGGAGTLCCSQACEDGERCGSDGECQTCEPGTDENCWDDENGTPLPACSAQADSECLAGTRVCGVSGTWGTCVGAAEPDPEDECVGCQCTGIETRCRAGSSTLLETCASDGDWDTSSCPFACVNGECGGECSTGASQCLTGPERRQSCNGGFWDTVETCPNGSTCVNGGAECRKNNGGSCSTDNQCVSGACVDGICCAQDCAAVSCTSLNNQCVTHPANVSSNLCGSNGQCKSKATVCGEHASYASSGSVCDLSGVSEARCDGAGTCAVCTSVECVAFCDSNNICWANEDNAGKMTSANAEVYCAGRSWAGKTWRLPTVQEWISIYRGCQNGTELGAELASTCQLTGCSGNSCQDVTNCSVCDVGEGPDTESNGCYWNLGMEGVCADDQAGYWSSTTSPAGFWIGYARTGAVNSFGVAGHTHHVKCVTNR